ncbi:fibronectin type III domain-containing protein [Terriglobus roseus]|uniref:fibronectin type III domain-containing protein n=1 Tax=Terriglobus roseus TaxID=392734 RepID=UPI0009F21CFA|nr:fibronectin type III domain-containing protein [Terriglobus roseus]
MNVIPALLHDKQRIAPVMVLWFLMAGCASQGPVRPPSLHLPAAVHGLTATRVGDAIDLAWTNPTRTTDGVSLTAKHSAGAMQAEVCRAEAFTTANCTPIAHLPATAGGSGGYHDVLPSSFAEGNVRTIVYRVRLVNSAGNGAGWTEVKSLAGVAPAIITGLRAQPVAQGILVQWQPGEDGVMLRVSRGKDATHSTLLAASDASTGKQSQKSSSGTVDTGGHVGEEQRYTVFRRCTVSLGGESFLMDSDPASVTVTASAKLPLPLPPTSLEALANTLSTPEVDLVWQPPDDAGVTGYRVYREESGATTLLTQEPLRGFTYADKSVSNGHSYRYWVASMNGTGEQRSSAVSVTLP